VAKVLLDNGAKPKARDILLKSPAELAAKSAKEHPVEEACQEGKEEEEACKRAKACQEAETFFREAAQKHDKVPSPGR
jgi:hypothetical protein